MKLIRASSARFAPQNEYRLPQYRVKVRPERRIRLVEGLVTQPARPPSDRH